MTKEEAIKVLNDYDINFERHTPEEVAEAHEMAIKALEQQPSEEEKVIRIKKGTLKVRTGRYVIYDVEWLKEHLPSVAPQPSEHTEERTETHECDKVGHWIEPQQDDGMSDPIYYQVRCSECNFDLDPQTWAQELHQYGADKYCPRCGCRMQEVKK